MARMAGGTEAQRFDTNAAAADEPELFPGERSNEPLQRLHSQGGVGVPLAAAAADVASHGTRYTARTQVATVVAYHVMEHGGIVPDALTDALLLLHERPNGSLFVDPGPVLTAWLALAADDRRTTVDDTTMEIGPWVAPLAIWFRDDVAAMVDAVIDLSLVFTRDAPSILSAALAAGSVAAGGMLMTGRDLILGVAETGAAVGTRLAERGIGVQQPADAEAIPRALDQVKGMAGSTALEIEALLARLDVPDAVLPMAQAIVLSADAGADPVHRMERAVEGQGSDAAVVIGGLVGGQQGLRRWPWRVANETWFAEIGRRLASGVSELGDLPIPHAVEERMRLTGEAELDG